MKTGFLLFGLFALSSGGVTAFSAPPKELGDLTLDDGRVFRDARIISVAPLRVTIRHAEGLLLLEKAKLPEGVRAEYPDDLAAAEAEATRSALAKVAADELRQQEAAKIEVERRRRTELANTHATAAAHQEAAADSAAANARAVAQGEAANYFRTKWRPGNTAVYITDLRVTIEDVEPVAGWPDRWSAKGSAWIEYYMSSGRSYTSINQPFEAQVQKKGYNTKCEITLR